MENNELKVLGEQILMELQINNQLNKEILFELKETQTTSSELLRLAEEKKKNAENFFISKSDNRNK